MKTNALFSAILSVFSLGCMAQASDHVQVKMGITQLLSETMPEDGRVIVGYRVEERINMNFGGRITTYTVPNLSMVSKIDLGPNNSRRITPIYGNAKVKAVATESAPLEMRKISLEPIAAKINIPAIAVSPKIIAPEKPKSIKIDIIDTYERTLEKGYESIDMLKRVANARYFDGSYEKAARWYSHLFALAKDLDAEFYSRYARSLKAIGQNAKASEMQKIYESKI